MWHSKAYLLLGHILQYYGKYMLQFIAFDGCVFWKLSLEGFYKYVRHQYDTQGISSSLLDTAVVSLHLVAIFFTFVYNFITVYISE